MPEPLPYQPRAQEERKSPTDFNYALDAFIFCGLFGSFLLTVGGILFGYGLGAGGPACLIMVVVPFCSVVVCLQHFNGRPHALVFKINRFLVAIMLIMIAAGCVLAAIGIPPWQGIFS